SSQTGVGKSTLINQAFKVDFAKASDREVGRSNIETEITFPENSQFVLHDSQGLEPGEVENLNTIKSFVKGRMAEPKIKDRLHAIWLCIEVPRAGGRLFETGTEELLRLGQDASWPPYSRSGLSTRVSDKDAPSLLLLVNVTYDVVAGQVQGDVWILWSVVQRVSVPLKLEASVAVGMKRYWQGLWAKAITGKKGFKACLDAVHSDMVSVWNFHDPQDVRPLLALLHLIVKFGCSSFPVVNLRKWS
ncbi:hypothetical protein JAAARDRAFT_136683, partial [Jaapia argillacea MUCL 33604]